MTQRIKLTVTDTFAARAQAYADAQGYASLSRAVTELAHAALYAYEHGGAVMISIVDDLEDAAPPHGGKRPGAGRKSAD